jgi:hypothetical protein
MGLSLATHWLSLVAGVFDNRLLVQSAVREAYRWTVFVACSAFARGGPQVVFGLHVLEVRANWKMCSSLMSDGRRLR